ncbi:VanZ family protein [Bacillus sp. JJ722]|uniref:VanZ family protein n=1 Tax=Bacillus sp. JJ722 TaxID=3122973 RepID=UPI0030008DFF
MNKSTFISLVASQLLFIVLLPLFIELFHYLHPLVYVIVWFCLTFLISFVVFLIRKETITISKRLCVTAAILYTGCLLVLLFIRPTDQSYDTYNMIPFQTVSFYLSGEVPLLVAVYNLTANIGLFIPYGALFLLLTSKRPNVYALVLVPFFSISLIEILQRFTNRGSLDIDDLLLNLIGVGIGYLITPLVQRVIRLK